MGGNALPNLLGLPNGRFIAVGIEIAVEAPRLRSRYKPRTPMPSSWPPPKGTEPRPLSPTTTGFSKVREGIEIIVVLDDLLKEK
ncbi:MAG TPA: hypothetical protein ENG73_01005 [Desulfobacterales bacterium]|nr:MAG: hypothetical protein DRN68_04200 [Nitrososphaerota archaeon]HDG96741.1 hypothetical protein [Desulfobacterales bacterium]